MVPTCIDCGERPRAKGRRVCSTCRSAKAAHTVTQWRTENRERHLANRRVSGKRYNEKRRLGVLEKYGNACKCCGETETRFLTMDHCLNDGAKHRKEIGRMIYVELYNKDADHARFQILCWNCNAAKQYAGICPHQINPKI